MDKHDHHHEESPMEVVKWVAAGFGVGLLIGAAMGLLLAPKSGRETREQIKGIATDLSARAKSTASDITEKAKSTYGRVADQAKTVGERAKTTAAEVTQKTKNIVETVKGTVESGKEIIAKVVEAGKEGFKKKMDELENEGDYQPEDSKTS